MGLKLIMEATVPPAVRQALLDFMGFTEKQVDALERSADDFSDFTKLSDEFATLGIKNLDDLQRHVAQEMGIKSINDVSDDVILKFMKQSPEIMQGVTKKLNTLVADAADAIIKKADWESIVGKSFADEAEFVLRQSIDADSAADDLPKRDPATRPAYRTTMLWWRMCFDLVRGWCFSQPHLHL